MTEMKVYLRERSGVEAGDVEMDDNMWEGAIEGEDRDDRGKSQNDGTTRFVWEHGVPA